MKPRPDQSSSSSPPEFLTVDEAAAILRVNRNTLYASIEAGEVAGVVRVGRTIRIRRVVLLPALTANAAGDLLSSGNSSNTLKESNQ